MGIKGEPRKQVGIVGAGAAGLCAARHAVEAGYDVTVFEQQEDVGGTWLYSPELDVFSSLYEKMNTNLPKQIMNFRHLPLETDGPESFVRHQEVLAYLRRYAKTVLNLISFNTVVTRIRREDSKWAVTVKPVSSSSTDAKVNSDLDTQLPRAKTFVFDVLFICHGHFSQPRIPQFANKLKLLWLHCHNYRRPHGYKDKQVAIVGAGPSGIDIAIQVSKYAKKVHLLHNQQQKFGLPTNVVDNARLTDVDEDGRTLLLENGARLSDIDVVILCTGYLYEVPFFEKNLIELKENSRYLSPLYQHCIHVNYPHSLFFIGLCWNLIPFICFDYQVSYALALVSGASLPPSRQEMEDFETERLKWLKEEGKSAGFFHHIGKGQWDYYNTLSQLANQPLLWPVIRKIYDHVHEQRSANLATFKSYRYKVLSPDEFDFEPLVDLDCN